jgi:DnaJ-class molecular chaperone
VSANNGWVRREERYRSAVQRQLAFNDALQRSGRAVAAIEGFLRSGDAADRHAHGCEPCGGEGRERWPNTASTGWVYSGRPCPDCNGEGVGS